MENASTRIENLERILRKLIEIYTLAPRSEAYQFRRWLDLAITETRCQIEKARLGSVH